MQHVMFDIDGTLVLSEDFDGDCYLEAVHEVVGYPLSDEWERYLHVTDSGILDQHVDELGLDTERARLHAEVKAAFVGKIADYLEATPAQPVPGADVFIEALRARDDVVLSIATGGWGETARMKLASAGIDVDGIELASSNDHHSRTEIMKIAATRAGGGDLTCTYFGDGEWDRRACAELGYRFVLVGDGARHEPRISDFSDVPRVLGCLGL